MANKIIFAKNLPTTLIFNGGNFCAIKLAENIVEEGGNVIIIDEFSKNNSESVRKLKIIRDKRHKGEIKILDIASNPNLIEILEEVRFAIFFGGFNNIYGINSSRLLRNIDLFFEIVLKNHSRYLVVTNVNKTDDEQFNEIEENLKTRTLKEMKERNGGLTTGSLIEMGEIYGETMDTFLRNPINSMLKSIEENKIIKVENRNRFYHYIYLEDAVNAIIKVLFSDSEGEYKISNKEDVSNISLAFRISDLTGFKVEEEKNDQELNTQEDRMKTTIGNLLDWTPDTSFENGITKTVREKVTNKITPTSIFKDEATVPFVQKDTESKNSFKKVNLSNFDKIKEQYLKNEYINQGIFTPERKKQLTSTRRRRKIIKYIVAILVIIFIVAPLIYSYINYESLLSNLSLQQQYLSSKQYTKVLFYNKKAQSNISTLKTYEGLYGPILSIFGAYTPTREITLSAFNLNNAMYYLINDTESINSIEALNLSNTNPAFISKMQTLSSPSYGSMQAKTALSELNSKSLMPALYKKLSFEISVVDSSFTSIQNKAEIYYTLLSGNKSYTIIYLNNNSLSSIQGNIAKYVYITISNGKVINIVNPNNAGDLNTIPKSTSVVASSGSISSLVNSAFKVTNTGVLYITKSAQDSFNSALSGQSLIGVYTGPNNNTRMLAINLIKQALGSHSIDLYITNHQYQYINLLLK
ncbi:MAG: hypothetical protein ACYDBX_01295 [Patescibacteria group bacterium]